MSTLSIIAISGSPPPVLSHSHSYFYMIKLERIFITPLNLLHRRDIPYERRRFLLRQWRNERARFVSENFRDWDYTQDEELENIRYALDALKRQPRKYI